MSAGAVNNGFGDLLPVGRCDYGTHCGDPVAAVVTLDAVAGAHLLFATAERRPMCWRHAVFTWRLLPEGGSLHLL